MIKRKFLKNAILGTLILSSISTVLSAKSVQLESGKDYIVSEARPNYIVLSDAKEMKVINKCEIDESFSPGGIVLAPNNKHAFVLGGYGQEIGGYDITNCKKIFHADLTQGDVRGQTLSGIAVSEDNKKVYAIYNRTKIGTDRYEVLDPMFSSYNVSDGIDAKAVKSFKIPRQMSMMGIAKDGTIFGMGSALYTLNPETEEVKVIKKLHGWNRKGFSDADSSGTYIIGQQTGDFTTLYYTEESDEKGEVIGWYWGITSVDLNTKEVVQTEFADYETLMFTAMRSPLDKNILYGSLNDLTKFNIKEKKVIKRVLLDHTYYSVVVSPDGKTLYLGGCLDDIAIYSADTLEKLGNISVPGDMGSSSLQVFHND